MGPLSKVWMALENADKSKKSKVEISLKDLTQNLEQSILLLGQSFYGVTYQRRLNVLQAIMKDSKAKDALKEKGELLEGNGANLFGKKFEEHLTSVIKSKRKCKELLKESYPDHKRKPFRRGPPSQENRRGGGRSFYLVKNSGEGSSNSHGKYK